MADFNYKEFKYKGKDIQYDGNTFITDIETNTSYVKGNSFLYNGLQYYATKDFTSHSTDIKNNITNGDIISVTKKYEDLISIMGDPTGFINPDGVNVEYISSIQRVILTGDIRCLYNGEMISGLDSTDATWVSEPHPDSPNEYFLKYNDNGFSWSTTAWEFKEAQIAIVYYFTNKFGLNEPHGLMDNTTHEELHHHLGTRRVSGGLLSDVTLNNTTANNRRPNVSECTVKDEDVKTVLPSLSKGNVYTIFNLSSTNTANLTINQGDIVPLSGNTPIYNQWNGSSWVQTNLPNNSFMSIWLIALPVTKDNESQNYRFIWIQGQSVASALATEAAKSPLDIDFGNFGGYIPEFVFLAQVIIRVSGGNWTIQAINEITGNRKVSGSLQYRPLSAKDIPYDNTLSELTATNVQDAIDELKSLMG